MWHSLMAFCLGSRGGLGGRTFLSLPECIDWMCEERVLLRRKCCNTRNQVNQIGSINLHKNMKKYTDHVTK